MRSLRERGRGRSRAVRRAGLRIVDSNRNDREQEMPHVESHEDRVLHRNLHPRQLLRPRGAMRPSDASALRRYSAGGAFCPAALFPKNIPVSGSKIRCRYLARSMAACRRRDS
jgi:hypothetical protein